MPRLHCNSYRGRADGFSLARAVARDQITPKDNNSTIDPYKSATRTHSGPIQILPDLQAFRTYTVHASAKEPAKMLSLCEASPPIQS